LLIFIRGLDILRSFKLIHKGDAFVMPAFIVLFVIIIVPILIAIFDSFVVTKSGRSIISLGNYKQIFEDSFFWQSMVNTIIFSGMSVLLHLILGLITALVLNQPKKVIRVFRVIILVPWAIPAVSAGLLWRWLYNNQYGIINQLLISIGFIKNNIMFLGSSYLAMPSVLFTNIWKGFPFVAIMLLAGLQTIPKEQYEAAVVDGANSIQSFWYITIPNLSYVIKVSLLLDFIWMFKTFDLIKLMTDGGPDGATEVISTLIVRQMFTYMDFSYATAAGVIMLVILLIVGFFYTKLIFKND